MLDNFSAIRFLRMAFKAGSKPNRDSMVSTGVTGLEVVVPVSQVMSSHTNLS